MSASGASQSAPLRDASALGATAGANSTAGSNPFGNTAGSTMQDKTQKTTGFRAHNVRFLQQQNQEVIKALERLEEERDEALAVVQRWEEKKKAIQEDYQRLQRSLADTEEKCNISVAEIHKRDEQIRVLSEQNHDLLDALEQEEKVGKEREAKVNDLTTKQEKLQAISDKYDRIKETGNQQLTSALTEIAKTKEDLLNATNETEQLREAERNFAAQAKADIEALEEKLKAAKDKNVEHLQQIQHNEVHEHRLNESLQKLKETLDELTVQKKGIRMQFEVDAEQRDGWLKSRTEVERRKDTLEKTGEALRVSLRSAEEQNRRMQDENKQGADNFRQLGDKVYALMDQLRQNQMELKRAETSGLDKGKKISALEKQQVALQDQLVIEVDAKLAAEAEARSAAQMQALLQKKNKMLDDALALALKAQEKVEKRLQELIEKANALQTQNEYLGTRIDGNEEDKGALRYELRKVEDELRQASTTHAQLSQAKTELDDRLNDIDAEKAALRAELDYIKREDMLDESGRVKPILIESESKLIERLQINEFLFSAQQARNPIPMLIEKVSHVLELLHTAQTQADVYLQDLQRSNSMLTALRQKNMTLYERVQLCETWKMRALLKIAANEFEMRSNVKGHNQAAASRGGNILYLDGLQYTNKELKELFRVINSYGKTEGVKQIRLQDNSLDISSVPHLVTILQHCPYLQRLDLKRNRLSDDAVAELQNTVERIPGVTSVNKDLQTGDIVAKSGAQVRIVINVEDQNPPDPNEALQSEQDVDHNGMDADGFLTSAAGVTTQTRLQGPDALGYPAGADGAGRTLMPGQRPGVGPLAETQKATLPPIASAAPQANRPPSAARRK